MTSLQPTRATRQLQLALIAFFVGVTISLVVIYAVQPSIYESATGGLPAPFLLIPLVLFEALLVVGTLQRWRWVFWLILVAFGASAIRVPVTALELAGILPPEQPVWYSLLRAAISVVQAVIAVWMLVLYRRLGVWACRKREAPGDLS